MRRFGVAADRILSGSPVEGDTLVVEAGRIEAVTWRHQTGDLALIEHRNAVLMPAFTDSHVHPLGYAALVSGLTLMEARDMADLQEILAEATQGLGPGEALIASRLDDTRLGRLPDRHDLDTAVPLHPLIVYRYCGHIAVANSAALDLAGVGETTPDPEGGSIDRDDDGAPTGVLRETAVELVAEPLETRLRPPSPGSVVSAMESLLATGITHIGAMASVNRPLWAGVGDEVAGLCAVAAQMPIDVDVMVIADTPDQLRTAADRIGEAGGRLRFWGWKSFADGSLGGHTAAMHEPFVDVATTGTLRLDATRGEEMARTALDLGGVVAMHAIGDRAIDETLDLFDRLLDDGRPPERLRIEHVSVPTAAAVSRMAATGVVASVQPSFLASEGSWAPARLGPDRVAYPLRTLVDAGVMMIAGSDCPVERPDPLSGVSAAVHRPGWKDREHLSLEEAVSLYTEAAASHFRRPTPLRPGSPADFLVVSNPGEPEATIREIYRGGRRSVTRPLTWPG